MLRALLVSIFAFSVNTATAQSMEGLASRSEFITNHLTTMKKNNVVSVYTSTKQYCPSSFWYTSRRETAGLIRRLYIKQLTRQMKDSGFDRAAISHCVENSGFVLENGQLADHPKNKKDTGIVRSGVMIVQNIGTGVTQEAPVLAEVVSYDDKSYPVYNKQFKQICTLTDAEGSKKRLNCGGYGTLVGSVTNQDSGRKLLIMSNEKYRMLMVTGRPASYARNRFADSFGARN